MAIINTAAPCHTDTALPEDNSTHENTTEITSVPMEDTEFNIDAMNSWERAALQYHFPENTPSQSSYTLPDPHHPLQVYQHQTWRSENAYDPSGIIYPGLYSASGFDLMSILIRVATRPHPQIELGPIDGSCSIILCDLQHPDTPVVYASEPFCELTGYSLDEVLGRNCRFLQHPPTGAIVKAKSVNSGSNSRSSSRSGGKKTLGSSGGSGSGGNGDAVRRIGEAVRRRQELQIEVVNFKKSGERFVNLLSLVPIPWGEETGYRYCVGFLGDRDAV